MTISFQILRLNSLMLSSRLDSKQNLILNLNL